MDFYQIKHKFIKKDKVEVYPDFVVCKSKDLMVRGKAFYAVWNDELGMWSTNEYDVQEVIDHEMKEYAKTLKKSVDASIDIRYMRDFSSKSWIEFKNYLARIPDVGHQLDENLTFSNTKVTRGDYVSKRLPYPLEAGDYSAWDEIIGTLYDPEEREKIEWAIGSIVAGEGKKIQKFLVLYGDAGTGKSTILNIIQKLFVGYYSMFEAKALASSNNVFSTEAFKSNPLVAIQHDGDLSRIEDNSKLNSIISHEEMILNEKYKASYTARLNCFLFMATNRPVKITDAKSGIIRRLIDVKPSGRKLPPNRYYALMSQIDFQLGAIASHCLDVYQNLGKNYYDGYRPFEMMFQTDVFFNFVEENFGIFKEQDGCTLRQAWTMYKEYCDDAAIPVKLPMYRFREELKNYFENFEETARLEDKQVRSYFSGFISSKFTKAKPRKRKATTISLALDQTESIFDKECSDCLAQYATKNEVPMEKWSAVKTRLSDINTKRLHYVRVPENHIVIDFDLKDKEGKKNAELNLEAASKWPPTYAEFSKGGAGIHLHYIYDGDVSKLSRVYSEGIEIKIFNGSSSLRRKLSKCNNIPIAHINSGLPLKGEKKVINFDAVTTEKTIRESIAKALRKEVHANTKPNMDFINKVLDDAYNSGAKYDVTDLRPKILAFANNSSNQAKYCIGLVNNMKFKSEENSDGTESLNAEEKEIIFYDVEVFPNLFLVNWKRQGPEHTCVRMINPKPEDIEELFKYRMVGFNCRRYDNHIMYARYTGYTNEQLYTLSQRIISGSRNGMFGEAYNLSYTDVYDFCAKKQSLKKWEIELGIHHQELGLPWDEPVPEDKWHLVAEYCDNDVIATEAVFNANQADWIARQILAELSGLTVNDTTNSHTKAIIFGKEKKPQGVFNYWDLSQPTPVIDTKMEKYFRENTVLPLSFDENSVLPYFPGYKFERGKSLYRGEDPKEGGYVYAEPGIHRNVALLDVASMHPTSLECMYMFGPYTNNFSAIKQARILIKHKDYDAAGKMFGGRLKPYLKDDAQAKSLSYALKIAINSVYGLTSAKFENECRDPRNIDNIVAKRGALFMIDLKHEVQKRGYTVAHIKTDSIKIPNATPEIIEFVMEFGKKYGYEFEHEATYEKMCLVNDAVYIAKVASGEHAGEWTATGTQFAVPFVFKTLFSHEPIEFKDLCETKTVTSGAIYLDMNEGFPDVTAEEDTLEKLLKKVDKVGEWTDELRLQKKDLEDAIAKGHNNVFVGRAGQFTPIKKGHGGGVLVKDLNGKYAAVVGTSGYRWLESEIAREICEDDDIDYDYYRELVDKAYETIGQYGDAEEFISDDNENCPPWCVNGDCSVCPDVSNCDTQRASYATMKGMVMCK